MMRFTTRTAKSTDILFFTLSMILWTGPAWAYEEMAVTDGGSIVGKILLNGEVPKPKGYNLTTLPDPIYCGRISDGKGWRLLQPFNVGPHGEFQQVVVRLEGVDKGKPFEEYVPPRIAAMDCRFMPL
jgi:hypothetical protein